MARRSASLRVTVSVGLLVLVVAAGVAIVGGHLGSPASRGSWSAAAPLIQGREGQTAILLKDGRVLVMGGADARGHTLASAEIYNPRTNTWQGAGTMSTPRVNSAATLLPNGEVLVSGGIDVPYLSSAELYDPARNRWSLVAPMHDERARHSAILLQDGRVLVVGGVRYSVEGLGGVFLDPPTAAEIFDPRTGRWSVTAPMIQSRLDPTVALLQDGRILVAGGENGVGQDTSAEIYAPKLNRWTAARSMAQQCDGATATVLASGKVLLIGGQGHLAGIPYPYGNVPISCVELYDPARDSWSMGASLPAGRLGHTSTLLENGNVLVVGDAVPGTSTAEIYSPARNQWSVVSQPMQRYNQTATLLPGGRVLIVGGYGLQSLNSAMIYDPTGGSAPLNPVLLGAWSFLTLALVLVVTMPAWRPRLRRWYERQQREEWIS